MIVKNYELLYNYNDDNEPKTKKERSKDFRCAWINNDVKLDGSNINWLQAVANPRNNKWSLERSTIERIDFWDPLPKKININGLNCKRFNLPGGKKDKKWRQNIIKASSNDKTGKNFQEAGTLFEKILRSEGRIEAANQVYAKYVIQNCIQGILFIAVVKGKIIWIHLILVLSFIIFAFGITAAEENWEQSPIYKSDSKTVKYNDNNTSQLKPLNQPVQIHNLHALIKAVEIGLPIIKIAVRDNLAEPQLKDRNNTTMYKSELKIPLPPESLAGFISVLGWIFGTLLLVAFSGFARRD